MPKWGVCLLGLLQDVLYGTPLGITAAGALLFWWFVISQRRYFLKEPFYAIWFYYGFASLVLTGMWWLGYCAYFSQTFAYSAPLIQWALGVALYPWVHKLFNAIHSRLLEVV